MSVRAVTDEKDRDRPWQLEIYNESPTSTTQQDREKVVVKGCKLDKTGAVVMGNHKVYRMSAASEEERDEWLACLLKVIRNEKVRELINGKLVKVSQD